MFLFLLTKTFFMNEQSRLKRLDESAIIHSIIFAFQGRVLYDIKKNLDRPETVGALILFLLERFPGYLFENELDKTPEKFVDVYMPAYKDVGLYALLRNVFASKFPGDLKTVITEHQLSKLRRFPGFPENRMLIEAFVLDFENALKRASDDLCQNEDHWQVAISWFRDHPVAVLERCSWFSDEETSIIYNYYIPKIRKHPVFTDSSNISLSLNFGERGYLVNVCMDQCFGREESIRVPLEFFIGVMGLKPPSKVLGWEDSV
jgi:hypothetical protein